MKKLIIINGTMGVGKSTICRELYRQLNNSVWLDGDWCWMMNPWTVTEENILMVEDNISHLLRNYLRNSSFEHIIFSWVIHREEISDRLLKKLGGHEFQLFKISLICSESALRERMIKDNRSQDSIRLSIERLKNYEGMDTIKIDTADQEIESVVERIFDIVGEQNY